MWTPVEFNDCDYLSTTKDEVTEQLQRLKNQNSPEEDGRQGEILKRLDEESVIRIHSIIEMVWLEVRFSEEWSIALVYTIYKTSDPPECNNYRGE